MKDRELVRLFFVEGKQDQAFRLIVKSYSEKLYWTIRRMVISHDDTDDLLQNTFIKVYQNLKYFEGKSSLYSWMYRIAVNEALNFLRKNKKWSKLSIEEITEEFQSDPYFNGDLAFQKLLVAMNQLPEKQALVFQLKYFDNMKYEEISELLGGTTGSLKASYHHATKKVEKFLAED